MGRLAEHGQSFQRVVPEVLIVSEGLKGFKKPPDLDGRIILLAVRLQLLYKIAKSNWVLLLLEKTPMGRLVE